MTITTLSPLPALHEYWKQPKPAAIGDDNLDAIYLQIGVAATTWETVDLNLAHIFAAFLDGAPHFGPERVFGLLINASAKIDALNAAAEVAFFWRQTTADEQKHYDLLLKHYKDASARRNEIVHAMVVRLTRDGVDLKNFLVPPLHSTRKNDLIWEAEHPESPYKYLYTSKDIKYLSHRFVLLCGWLSEFSAYYRTKYVPPRTHSTGPIKG